MVYSLVLVATGARWCFNYFKSVEVCLYVPVPRIHGSEVLGEVYFHIKSLSNYREVSYPLYIRHWHMLYRLDDSIQA